MQNIGKRERPAVELVQDAIREVNRGGAPMSSQIARKVVHYFHENPPTGELATLSTRENEI